MTPKAIDITINARIGNARIGVTLSAALWTCAYVTGGRVCFVCKRLQHREQIR